MPRLLREAFALEVGVLLAALRFILGRAQRPAGFSYERDQLAVYVLYALPLLLLPDVLLGDILLRHWPALRWTNDALHLYLIVWGLGVTGALRSTPHRVADGRAELHLGPFMRAGFDLEAIASARVRPEILSRATRRALRADAALLLLPQTQRSVEITLHRPIAIERALYGTRYVSKLFVVADRPHQLAAALLA